MHIAAGTLLARGLLDLSIPAHKAALDEELPPMLYPGMRRERAAGGGGGGGGAAARVKRERGAAGGVIDLTGAPRGPPPDPLLEARPAQSTALHARALSACGWQAKACAQRAPLCATPVLPVRLVVVQWRGMHMGLG